MQEREAGWGTALSLAGILWMGCLGGLCARAKEESKAGAFSAEAGLVERAPSPPCLLLPPKEE